MRSRSVLMKSQGAPASVTTARPQLSVSGRSASANLRDEKMNDLIAREASAALLEACGGSTKDVAEAAGVTRRQARRYATSRSCPLYPASQLVRKSSRRWQMVAHMAATAVLGDLEEEGQLTEARMREIWAEADREDVRSETADLNQRMQLDYDGNLDALYRADSRVVGPMLRRMVLSLICRRRGWDPRPSAGSKGRA